MKDTSKLQTSYGYWVNSPFLFLVNKIIIPCLEKETNVLSFISISLAFIIIFPLTWPITRAISSHDTIQRLPADPHVLGRPQSFFRFIKK